MILQRLRQNSKEILVIRQNHPEPQNGISTSGSHFYRPNVKFPGRIIDLSSAANPTHHPTSSDDGIRRLLDRNKPEQYVGTKEAASITRIYPRSKIGASFVKSISGWNVTTELLIHLIHGKDLWRMDVEIADRSLEVWVC
jgi:hypothetical protein